MLDLGTYDVGDVVEVIGEFNDRNKVPLNPGTIKLYVRKPSSPLGTVTTYQGAAVVQDGVGRYHVDVECTESGTWRGEWEGTPPGKGVEPVKWSVRKSSVRLPV